MWLQGELEHDSVALWHRACVQVCGPRHSQLQMLLRTKEVERPSGNALACLKMRLPHSATSTIATGWDQHDQDS